MVSSTCWAVCPEGHIFVMDAGSSTSRPSESVNVRVCSCWALDGWPASVPPAQPASPNAPRPRAVMQATATTPFAIALRVTLMDEPLSLRGLASAGSLAARLAKPHSGISLEGTHTRTLSP